MIVLYYGPTISDMFVHQSKMWWLFNKYLTPDHNLDRMRTSTIWTFLFSTFVSFIPLSYPHEIFTCHDRINTVTGGAYLTYPEYPGTIKDRASCFFNFTVCFLPILRYTLYLQVPGNYILTITWGYFTNATVTINSNDTQ